MEQATLLHCPALACGGLLQPEMAHGVTVDRCDRCRGVWFDAHELDRWLADFLPDLRKPPEDRVPRRGVGGHPCPRCHERMEAAGWSGLVLDRCSICHGIFADTCELAHLEGEGIPVEVTSTAVQLKELSIEAVYVMAKARVLVALVTRFLV